MLVLGFLVTTILWDPFRIFFNYSEYYRDNRITGNREAVCLKLFKKHANKERLNSFIIGSSRSQAFKASKWASYIGKPVNGCFHFDGNGLGLYRATNILKYLDSKVNTIDNLLLVVNHDFFKEIQNPEGHLFIQPPEISKEPYIKYYLTFIKAGANSDFLICNLVYNLSGNYYPFMKDRLISTENSHISENQTGDLYYSYDRAIIEDSAGYYENLLKENVFYTRVNTLSTPVINSKKQIDMLNQIRAILIENNTKFKIVISPLYDQIPLHENDLLILQAIFGEKIVFNYSGVNEITNNKFNYYESSHYKPYVANKIMREVYSD